MGRRWRRGLLGSTLAGLATAACGSQPGPPVSNPGAAVQAAPSAAAVAARAPVAAGAAPLRLWSVEEGRAGLVVAASVPSLDRSLTTAAELARPVSPMPIDPQSLRALLLGQVGLPPDASQALDAGSPIGAVLVTIQPGRDPGVALAVGARSGELAEKAVAALGRVVSRRGEARQVENAAGGRIWLWRSGDVVVIADSAEALERGGRLALEARRGGAEDATAVFYPDAIARHAGTDVQIALGRASALVTEGDPASQEIQRDFLSRVADAQTGEIALRLDAVKGITIAARLHARPGSTLARDAREATPAVIDPLLLRGDDIVAVGGSSYGSFAMRAMQVQRQRIAASQAPGAAAALRFMDAVMASDGGQMSIVLRGMSGLVLDGVNGIKDAAAAAKLQAALLGLDKAAITVLAGGSGAAPPEIIAIKKEKIGKIQALTYSMRFDVKGSASAERGPDFARALGTEKLDGAAAVIGTRLVFATGPDAKARLAALAAGGAPPAKKVPPPDLAAAVAESTGRDGFFFADLARLAPRFAAVAPGPQAAALARLKTPIPIHGTYGGDGKGDVMTFELRLPKAAFTGLGAALQTVMGMGGPS